MAPAIPRQPLNLEFHLRTPICIFAKLNSLTKSSLFLREFYTVKELESLAVRLALGLKDPQSLKNTHKYYFLYPPLL